MGAAYYFPSWDDVFRWKKEESRVMNCAVIKKKKNILSAFQMCMCSCSNQLLAQLINTVIIAVSRLLILLFIPVWSPEHLHFYAITFFERE
jgi:hypothetical protein